MCIWIARATAKSRHEVQFPNLARGALLKCGGAPGIRGQIAGRDLQRAVPTSCRERDRTEKGSTN